MSEFITDSNVSGRVVELKAYAAELTKNYNVQVDVKHIVEKENGRNKHVYYVFNPNTGDVYYKCEDVFELTGVLQGIGLGKLEFKPEVEI